jgi:hypothetical protein
MLGFALSYLIMGTLFFLIIGPIAVLMRLFGRDALHRRYDAKAAMYWSNARPPRDKRSGCCALHLHAVLRPAAWRPLLTTLAVRGR